jgi:hypothetical protein
MNERHPRSGNDFNAIRRLVHEAISVWEHNSNLKFREAHPNDANNADIRIDFARLDHGDGFEFTGPSGTLAHAFPPGKNIGGDVHMDNDEKWDIEDGNKGDVSFFYTLLHEVIFNVILRFKNLNYFCQQLGHSLGLSHSNTKDSIMYAWYVSGREWDRKCAALYEDDIHGIAQHYGDKPEFKFGRKCKDNSYPQRATKVPTRTTPRSNNVDIITYRPDNRPEYTPGYRPHTRPPYNPNTRRPYYPDQDPNQQPRTRRPYEPEHEPTRRPDRDPQYEPAIPRVDEKPDKCNTNFDAITSIRGELWIFKGRWFWRLRKDPVSQRFKPLSEEPYSIGAMFNSLSDLDHVDAVYKMKNENIAFFVDRKVYIIDISAQIYKLVGVTDIKHFGFNHELKKVDAIIDWSHNNKTYVFNGDRYWK